jgi:ABC-2 type transport system permease protein
MTEMIAKAAGFDAPTTLERMRYWFADVRVMTQRYVIHIRREPMQLSDVTVQPVLFTLLFIYIFGTAMVVRGGGSYKDFALAGLLMMNLTTSSVGTAIGLSTDLSTGMINRLRTLPMSPTAILFGRSISDLLAAMICSSFVVMTGLVVGWRPDAGAASIAAGFAIALFFSYALTWAMACLGLLAKSPESAQGIVMLFMFPLAFVSNVFAATQGMPTWLATIANWNPVSAVTSACRSLFGNPNPSSTVGAWPMQHPVAAALVWSVAILLVSVLAAGHLYRHRTSD